MGGGGGAKRRDCLSDKVAAWKARQLNDGSGCVGLDRSMHVHLGGQFSSVDGVECGATELGEMAINR